MKKLIIGLVLLIILTALPVYGNTYLADLIMKGRLDEAREYLGKSETSGLSPNTVKYYTGLLESDGNLSAKYLKESLYGGKHFEEKDLAALRLAHYYFARGFNITCINQLETFETDNPGSSRKDEAGWLLGTAYLNGGKFDKAQSKFRKVIESYPESVFSGWSFMGLGYCYYKSGEYNRAIGSFNRLIDDNSHPAYPQALVMLSLCYETMGDNRRAKFYRSRYDTSYPRCFYGEALPAINEISKNIPTPPEIDPDAEKLVGAKYYIQVGAFSSKNNARRMQQRVEKRGYRSRVERQVVNKQSYYKVLVGPYSTRVRARAAKEKLEREEQDNFLIILK